MNAPALKILPLVWKQDDVTKDYMVWSFDHATGYHSICERIDSDWIEICDEDGENILDESLRQLLYQSYRAAGGEYEYNVRARA